MQISDPEIRRFTWATVGDSLASALPKAVRRSPMDRPIRSLRRPRLPQRTAGEPTS